MKEIKFQTPYSKKVSKALKFKDVSLTKQSDAKDADINNIMDKYKKTGQLPEMIKSNPKYGDFSEIGDYQSSMNIVLKAGEQFDALPAAVRKQFENDPAQFLEFANNPDNLPDMVEMGLASYPEVPLEPQNQPSEAPAAEAQASQGTSEQSEL